MVDVLELARLVGFEKTIEIISVFGVYDPPYTCSREATLCPEHYDKPLSILSLLTEDKQVLSTLIAYHVARRQYHMLRELDGVF